MKFNELVGNIALETFSDVISSSPRKVRESLYSHYGLKQKTSLSFASLKSKKEKRVSDLKKILEQVENPKEQEFLKELFRSWLFTKRSMLKDALDFLNVPNDNGLIEVEPDFFKKLNSDQTKELINALKTKHPIDNIKIYLTFMEVPDLDRHLLD